MRGQPTYPNIHARPVSRLPSGGVIVDGPLLMLMNILLDNPNEIALCYASSKCRVPVLRYIFPSGTPKQLELQSVGEKPLFLDRVAPDLWGGRKSD